MSARPEDSNPLLLGVYWPSIISPQTWAAYNAGEKIPGLTVEDEAEQLAAAYHRQRDRDFVSQLKVALRNDDPKALDLLRPAVAADQDAVYSESLERVVTSPPPSRDWDDAFRDIPSDDPVGEDTVRGGFSLRILCRGLNHVTMKNRAACVGAGVDFQAMLASILAVDPAIPVHLAGHSFGCKLLLEALHTAQSAEMPFARKITSLTLVQPAISRWALSQNLPPHLKAYGIYKDVHELVHRPILIFFSHHDAALLGGYMVGFAWNVEQLRDARKAEQRRAKFLPRQVCVALGNLPSAALGAHGPVEEKDFALVCLVNDWKKIWPPPSTCRILGVEGRWNHSHRTWCTRQLLEVVLDNMNAAAAL